MFLTSKAKVGKNISLSYGIIENFFLLQYYPNT